MDPSTEHTDIDTAELAPTKRRTTPARAVAAGRRPLVSRATRLRWKRTWRSRLAASAMSILGVVGGAGYLAATHPVATAAPTTLIAADAASSASSYSSPSSSSASASGSTTSAAATRPTTTSKGS